MNKNPKTSINKVIIQGADMSLNPHQLLVKYFQQGNWSAIPKADDKSVADLSKPLTRAEKQERLEDYYLNMDEKPTPLSYYRFVDGEAQVLHEVSPLACVAEQLNDSLKLEFEKIDLSKKSKKGKKTAKSKGSKGTKPDARLYL